MRNIYVSLLIVFLAVGVMTAETASEGGAAPEIKFVDITEQSGAKHRHQVRNFEGKHADVLGMFSSGGASVAVGDYDNDGLTDIFVTNSEKGTESRLFHNLGNMRFEDVTDSAGVGGGNDAKTIVADALWFDYDNDGRVDLLVARFGTPLLYHNEGNGKFKDVTKGAGFNRFGNTLAVTAFDYNMDGHVDLMFGDYFPPENLLDLTTTKVLPHDLDNASNGGGVSLWRNDQNGKFTDVTDEAGLSHHKGWTLDQGHGDFDLDGDPDVYVASDYGTDRIFFNNGDGTFEDRTETSIGFDTKKGMNAEVADYDNDGYLDVYVTNITDEYMKECNMLWHNNQDGTFTDLSKETGTCDTLWGWGAKFGDFDNDGWQDLYAVNGLRSADMDNYIPVLVEMIITPDIDFSDLDSWPGIGSMSWSGYQKSKFFKNLGMHAFKEMAADAGVDNDKDGRGVALADFDNDGLLDIYVTNADQDSIFYRNQSKNAGNWIQLKLMGTKSNRDAIGARVTLKTQGMSQVREVAGGNGYEAQSTTRLHFGIGSATKIDDIEIRWPSGAVEKVKVPLNSISYIEEGKGMVQRPSK